jgi:hypothetical protein
MGYGGSFHMVFYPPQLDRSISEFAPNEMVIRCGYSQREARAASEALASAGTPCWNRVREIIQTKAKVSFRAGLK